MTCKGHREVVVHLRLCNRDSVRSASTLLLRARTMLCCLASRGILPQATPSQNRPCPVSEMRSTWLESRGRSHGSALTCSSVCLASLVSRQTRVPVSVFLLLQWQCANVAGQGSLSDISVGISDINAIWLKVRRKSMSFRGVSLRVYKRNRYHSLIEDVINASFHNSDSRF